MNPFQRAIKAAGGLKPLADLFGITPQAVHKWRKRVPANRCRKIEDFVNGAVTCEELRPDVFVPVLRQPSCEADELKRSEGAVQTHSRKVESEGKR